MCAQEHLHKFWDEHPMYDYVFAAKVPQGELLYFSPVSKNVEKWARKAGFKYPISKVYRKCPTAR